MKIDFQSLINKKVLIMGDVGTGKTLLLVDLLKQAFHTFPEKTTLIDFAPSSQMIKGMKVGGLIEDYIEIPSNSNYLKPERVETPRLSAKTPDELKYLTKLNAERMTKIILNFLSEPRPIVFFNDISLFFQGEEGDLDLILKVLDTCETVIINGYYGEYLAKDLGTKVSKRERDLMDELSDAVDLVIHLKKKVLTLK